MFKIPKCPKGSLKTKNYKLKTNDGFTLVEVLIYAAVFSVSAVFLVNILTAITNIQLRQASTNEVSNQIALVSETVKRLVRESSNITNTAGTASSSLSLRMASSSYDPTVIYTDASSTAIFLVQGTSTPIALTGDRVTVGNFSVTKYENPGGTSVVQVDLTLDYKTESEQSKNSQTWRSAIARVSAATFDSSLLPSADGSLNLGASNAKWNDVYFGGTVRSVGDIAFTNSSVGLVLVSPSSTCFRVGISNAGLITTSSVACP